MSGSRKRRLIAGIAAVGALALTATACSSSKSGGSSVATTTVGLNNMNSGTPKKGGSLTIGIEKQITDWDQFDASGATEDFVYLENGYWQGSPFIQEPDASIAINPDFVTSAQVTSSSPQTIVYQINPKAVWNDGTPITADDFKLTWLFQAGVDPLVSAASTSGYQDIASVVGSGTNNQTVTVTWKAGKVDPDWKSLFQVFPAHIAAQHGYDTNLTLDKLTTESANGKTGDTGLENSFKWFDATVPTWSDGAYVVQSAASDGSKVVEVPNAKWWGAKGPYFDKVTFTAITDSAQETPALQNGEVNVIIPQPDQSIVKGVKNIGSKVKYQLDPGLQYEHIDLNMKNTFFGGTTQADQQNPVKLALRQALFTVIDRKAIIARTQGLVDSSSKPLNARMFVPTQSQYTDNLSSTGQGSGDLAKAKQILQSAGYTNIGQGQKLTTPSGQQVPAFVMRYTSTNSERATESQLVATEAAQLGITINVEGTDSLDKTLNQADANHAYDIVVFAWVDTAFWATGNPPLFETNPSQTGPVVGGNYGFYTNTQVDSLLQQATNTLDLTKAASLENQADKLISADAYTLPLFQKDSMIAFDSSLVNVRDNITSTGQTYNIQEWGYAS